MPRKNYLLIPIDSTTQTIVALKQSYNLARYTHSEVVLLHCFENDETKEVEYMQTLAKDVEKESGLTVKVRYASGNVFNETMKIADELEPVLIVLGLTSKITTKNFF